MALTGNFSSDKLTETKLKMESLLMDRSKYDKTKDLLCQSDLTDEQRKTLTMFKRTFECYLMPNEEATKLREDTTATESKLEQKRNTMKLGFTLDGEFHETSSVGLRNKMRVSANEDERKACYMALREIGNFIVDNGFIDIVKKRNKLAKQLGYEDFYDYKVTAAEGFGKKRLFEILDGLEQQTRDLTHQARARLAKEKGEKALEPWNMGYMMSGDITARLDPYFPFGQAVEMWGRSFSNMSIDYRGATMNLDLLDRKHKYSNGFCHWPKLAWTKSDGSFQPSTANFTSLADPSAIGSGNVALATLMHEAGHAAHFANITQPSPLFAQERAPTSVAYAETQSMFLDSLVDDARWRGRYARDTKGNVLPFDIHAEELRLKHPYSVFSLRAMIAVPYLEKRLYELPEDEVTAENILRIADEVEKEIQGGPAGRYLLSVPHIMSDESSCYYHGYVLAEMAVHQTRKHFLDKYEVIVDNANIGKDICEAYWKCGNSEMFLDLVERLTGGPLVSDAWVQRLEQDVETLIENERKEYDIAVAQGSPLEEGEVNLNMRMRLIDGEQVLADSNDGGFLAACHKFQQVLKDRVASK